ncbi:MAG: hypothetical protein JO265_08990 [Acidimicrobiia bacterium]|nr:hypothetical protein [Acidimicrobiia bacterium]
MAAHMVIFRRPDGKPAYHQAEGVEDALRFVEMLRNQEKVTDARIFRMEEVPIEVRTYYKVEVAGEQAHPNGAPHAPATPNGAPEVAPVPPAVAGQLDPMPVEVGAGKGRRFGRS